MKNKNRGFANFTITTPGTYEFILENEKYKTEKKVTLASHVEHKAKDKSFKLKHIDSLNNQLQKASQLIGEIHFEQQMLTRKFQSHSEHTQSHNSKITSLSIIETVIMVVILVGQMVYLKQLARN